jgi:hypothetical protein
MFDNVVFAGFSRGSQVGDDVLMRDSVRIVNSDFGGSENQLDIHGKT